MSNELSVVSEPARGTLLAAGPDAVAWLNGLLTCDVATVGSEQGGFGLLLSKQGKIQSDLTLLSGPRGLLLSVAPDCAAELAQTLERYLVMEDAEISDLSTDFAWARFCGALALERATEAAQALGGVAGRVAWSRAEAAALALPRALLAELTAWVTARADARWLEPAEWEALRIEQGIPSFGVDFGSDDNPHEAGLDRRAISWSKGCYLGQEVVCMQDMRGKLKRRLVTLAIDAGAPPPRGAKVTLSAGVEAGEVTSSAPRADAAGAWALARLKSPFFEGQEPLEVAGHGARVNLAG